MRPDDREKLDSDQRHSFLMHYYNMSVQDLSRHLGIGWQTLALAGGGVVVLGVGYSGDLPVPVAVAVALVIFFWGLLNILDSNYWSVRAIGFLANVEALYLSLEDQSRINPYVGRHPNWKMLNSLRHQHEAIWGFIAITWLFYSFWLLDASSIVTVEAHLFTALPILVTAPALTLVAWKRYARAKDYREFVEGSPGPGLVRSWSLRSPDLSRNDMTEGKDGVTLQAKVLAAVREREVSWENRYKKAKRFLWWLPTVLWLAAALLLAL